MNQPLLYTAIDVGLKRDTTAVASIAPMDIEGKNHFVLWGCAVFEPPVNMITQIQPYLLRVLKNNRIVSLGYDYYQFATTHQWLIEEGYGSICQEIPQTGPMIKAANTLHAHCWDGTFLMPKDGKVRNHFISCRATNTERGWRIIKQKQSKVIDAAIATAMALMMATDEEGHIQHPSAMDNQTMSAVLLP